MPPKIYGLKKELFVVLAFSLIFLSSGSWLRAQEFNLTGGFGTPEMLNVGGRVQVDQVQYGLNVGTNLGYKNDNFNVSGDFYYHFGGRSSLTDLQPWYVKTGLTYLWNEGEWEKRTNLLLVPRLGREINISEEFGVALEAGLMVLLVDRNQTKKERTPSVSGDLDLIGSGFIMPSAGLKVFYRLF